MQINLEAANTFAIQSYDSTQLVINGTSYASNLIVCADGILTDWSVKNIKDLENNAFLALLETLGFRPEIIIIGHPDRASFAPSVTRDSFMKEQIGFESMSLGAACRTYNVLLGEDRKVVLGVIF